MDALTTLHLPQNKKKKHTITATYTNNQLQSKLTCSMGVATHEGTFSTDTVYKQESSATVLTYLRQNSAGDKGQSDCGCCLGDTWGGGRFIFLSSRAKTKWLCLTRAASQSLRRRHSCIIMWCLALGVIVDPTTHYEIFMLDTLFFFLLWIAVTTEKHGKQ